MSDLLTVYEDYLKTEKQASANTVSSYLRDVRQFAAEMQERDIPITEVLRHDVEEYARTLTGRGKSPATVTRSVASIKSFYSYMLTVGAVSAGVMEYTIYKNVQQQNELAEYRATKAIQEQKLQELNQLTEKVQQDMAALSKVEDQVRHQMEKSGMHVPKKSLDPAKYGGQGGPHNMKALMTRIDVSMEQNKNMHAMLQEQAKDWKNLLEALKQENHRKEYTPTGWPLNGGVITSRYGGRRDPIYGGRDNHPGIDIGADHGTPVYASAAGVVEQAEWYYGYGNFIRIAHDYGYETAYGHLSSFNVKAGQVVEKGQFIGRVGSTGYSTGPHLHFEVRLHGRQINPMKMF